MIALAALVAASAPALLGSETLAVVVGFRGPWSRAAIQEMEREVESVLDIAEMQLTWRFLQTSPPSEVFDRVVVARFAGDCRSAAAPPPEGRSPLAFTHVTDGAVLPFAEVDCDRVRRMIGDRLRPSHGAGAIALGRALGRVLAHELYHILGATRKHAKTGIAKPVLTPADLTGLELRFEESSLRTMRDHVRPRPNPRLAATAQ